MEVIKRSTFGYTATLPIPSVEEVAEMLKPEAAESLGPIQKGEVVALGTAVYEGIKPAAYDSHKKLVAAMSSDVGVGNLWLLPSYPRLPYPYSVLYTVAGLFRTEKEQGRKADWLLWVDDDVVVPSMLYRALRNSADPVERPFMTAVACDRSPPFHVAIWSMFKTEGGLEYRKQWIAPDPPDTPEAMRYKIRPDEMWMPETGVHEIAVTGLCGALIHRSLFDKVPQPWFAVAPGEANSEGKIAHKINTDSWWCQQLHDAGIKRYANCDVRVLHLGFPLPVAVNTVPLLRKVFGNAR